MPPDADARRPAYDAIAHLYDVDMARNMPFDDIAFYERICREAPAGPVLELGCGNGRVMLELAARGLDVVGVDGSTRMLTALVDKAQARALLPRVCRMDARTLGFARRFGAVLCPYSLVTYMGRGNDAARMLDEALRVAVDGGSVVIDAFVPRPSAANPRFKRDYVRAFGPGALMRFKRITPLGDGRNRIDRRYDMIDAAGRLVERVETSEDIRPFTPDEVLGLLETAGCRVCSTWWNYTSAVPPADAQFFTAVAQAV